MGRYKNALIATLVALVTTQGAAQPLPSGALVVTHASRYYHTDEQTIAATNQVQGSALTSGAPVFALGQHPVMQDPEWYGAIDDRLHTALSRAGEHDLYPVAAASGVTTLTAVGGYFSACLGRTLSELVARFITGSPDGDLNVHLPMAAIYTGYLFDADGQLQPTNPRREAALDDSIDGLNLSQATSPMDDAAWTGFMLESLAIAVFEKSPMLPVDDAGIEYRLLRDGAVMSVFGHDRRDGEPRRVIQFLFE